MSGESYGGVYVPLVAQVRRRRGKAWRYRVGRTARRSSSGIGGRVLVVGLWWWGCGGGQRQWFRVAPALRLSRAAVCAVPLQAVLDGNDAGQEPRLDLRGYLVGNGVTDPEFDGNALVPFALGKSLIRCGWVLVWGGGGAGGWRSGGAVGRGHGVCSV